MKRMKTNLTPEEVYDKLFRIADHLLKQANPCDIQTDAKGKVTCTARRAGSCWDSNGLCCSKGGTDSSQWCEQLSPTGCKVQNLRCKLFLCGAVDRKHNDLHYALRMLEDAAIRAMPIGVVQFYRSKEQLFAEAKAVGAKPPDYTKWQ